MAAMPSFDIEAFEAENDIVLPRRLRRFYADDEAERHAGRHVANLPMAGDSTLEVRFAEPSFDMLTDNDMSRRQHPGVLPFVGFDGECSFLVVGLEDPCPVSYCNTADASLTELAGSLDEFLADLREPGARVRPNDPEYAFTLAVAAHHDGNDEEAFAYADHVFAHVARKPLPVETGWSLKRHYLGQLWNLKGALLVEHGDRAGARSAFDEGLRLGDDGSRLNLITLAVGDDDAQAVVALAEPVLGEGFLQYAGWFTVRRRLAVAYLQLGAPERAEAVLRELHAACVAVDHPSPEHLATTRAALEAHAAAGRPGADQAREALGWFV
jgi:tetratricopeptide (TPR) repeat protein